MRKLIELGLANGFTEQVFMMLDEQFSILQLEDAVRRVLRQFERSSRNGSRSPKASFALAKSNYESSYEPDQGLSERCIFPYSPTETNGIEDARFVQFHEDDGSTTLLRDVLRVRRKIVLPQMLETEDFLRFKISTLNGPEVRNKGFALFPRKVGGHYAMLSRQDNENIYIMYSDMLHFWYSKELIFEAHVPLGIRAVGQLRLASSRPKRAGWCSAMV